MSEPRNLTLSISAYDHGSLTISLVEGDQLLARGERSWSGLWTGISGPLSELEVVPNKKKRRLDSQEEPETEAEPIKDLRPSLHRLGRLLWDDLLPQEVRDLLGEAANAATARQPLALALAIEDNCPWAQELMRLPWAALWPDTGLPLGLRPNVALWQKVTADPTSPAQAPAPPLRLVFAVSLPGEASNLDFEREEELILKALLHEGGTSAYRGSGPKPFVSAVEEGHLEAILDAAQGARAQLLHLTGHGHQGKLLLEDWDGDALPITGKELAESLAQQCSELRLVVLSECLSASPEPNLIGPDGERLWGVAAEVARKAAPALGMLWKVFDHLASAWAHGFYAALEEKEWQPLWALAEARRDLAALLEAGFQQGRPWGHGSEWACPVLFAAGVPEQLFDPKGKELKIDVGQAPSVMGWKAAREVGAFIGRRAERRELLRDLLGDPPRARPPHPVAVLRGLGGVGKSALAAKLIESLASRRFRVAIHFGQLSVPGLLASLAKLALDAYDDEEIELKPRKLKQLQKTAATSGAPTDAEEQISLDESQRLLEPILKELRYCLVLDDFEQNLNLPPELRGQPVENALPLLPSESYLIESGELSRFLAWLAQVSAVGKVLVTCRYGFRLPEGESLPVVQRMLRGLPEGDALKLILRLRGFNGERSGGLRVAGLSLAQRKQCVHDLGGHPRALELMDVVLRRPDGDWRGVGPRVQERVQAWISQGLLKPERAPNPEEALQQALIMASDDVLLDVLIQELKRLTDDPSAVALLHRLSVLRQPFGPTAPRMLADPAWLKGGSNPQATLNRWQKTMDELGLLHRDPGGETSSPAPDPGPRWLVPQLAARLLPTTGPSELEAQRLRSDRQGAHRRAASYYQFLEKTSQPQFDWLIERRFHLMEAGEWAQAAEVTRVLSLALEHIGAYGEAIRLNEEVLQRAPSEGLPRAQRLRLGMFRMRCLRVLLGAKALLPLAYSLMMEALGRDAGLEGLPKEPEKAIQEVFERLVRANLPAALEQSLKRREELGDETLDGVVCAAYDLAWLLGSLGEKHIQRDILKASASICEDLGEQGSLSNIQYQLAAIETFRGNYTEARQLLTQSIEIKERIGHHRGLAHDNLLLARIANSEQKPAEALRLVTQSLEIYRRIDDRSGELASHLLLAEIDLAEDNYSKARDHILRSRETAVEDGDRQGIATCLYLLSIIEERQGNYFDACQLLERSMEIRDEIGDRVGRAGSLAQLGTWKLARGEIIEARKLLQDAADIFEEIGDGAELDSAKVLIYLGSIESLNKPSVGLRMVRQGVERLERLGHPSAMDKRTQFREIGSGTFKAVRAARAARGVRDDQDLAYEEGACALLIDRPQEAEPPLRLALEAYRKKNQPAHEAQVAWTLSRALSLLGQDHQAEAAELATAAKARARELNMVLPWFPDSPKEEQSGNEDIGQ